MRMPRPTTIQLVEDVPSVVWIRTGNSSSSGTNARLVGWRAFSRYPNHQRGRVVAAGCLQ